MLVNIIIAVFKVIRVAAHSHSESHLSAKCLVYILLKLLLCGSKENFDTE